MEILVECHAAAVLGAVSKLSDAGNWSIEVVDLGVPGYLKSCCLVSGLIGLWLARLFLRWHRCYSPAQTDGQRKT